MLSDWLVNDCDPVGPVQWLTSPQIHITVKKTHPQTKKKPLFTVSELTVHFRVSL